MKGCIQFFKNVTPRAGQSMCEWLIEDTRNWLIFQDVKAKTTMVDECGAALRVDREEQRNQLARQDASVSVPLPSTMMRGRSPLGRSVKYDSFFFKLKYGTIFNRYLK